MSRFPLLTYAAAVMAVAAPPRAGVSNSIVDIRFDRQQRGALAAVTDRATGAQLISASATLFRLTVVDAAGKLRQLTAADAASWDESSRADEFALVYLGLGGQKIDLVCRVRLGHNDRLSRWTAEIRNGSDWTLRALEYPVLNVPLQLGDEAADDRLLYPVHHGQIVPQPGANLPTGRRISYGYPGSVAAQFMAYYDSRAGLYAATYDSDGHSKHFGLLRGPAGIEMILEHNIPEEPGRSWRIPYEVALGTFHGDWYAAADLYKQWAEQQPWCARRLTRRGDIPGWYLRGLPILMFVPRGRESGPLPPPGWRAQAPALFREAAAALRSPVIVVEYAWEKWGSWINPDVFPPYGGDAAFARQVRDLKQDGNLFGCYLSGTRWGIKKPGTDYDGRAAFERLAVSAATTDEAQQPIIENRPWADNVRLCIGSPLGRRLLIDEVRGLVERGVDWVQFDQNLGCEAYLCYNRQHPHPGGFGKWMADDTRTMLAEGRRLGKTLNPGFALTVEEPCEYFIQDLDGYNDRPYVYAGFPLSLPAAEAVPLFSYLYREYALGFGGDSAIRLDSPLAPLVKLARGMAAGLLVEGPPLAPNRPWTGAEPQLLAHITEAQQQFAHDYLVYGRMLPPPTLEGVPMQDARILENAQQPTAAPATAAPASQQAIMPRERYVPGRAVRVPVVFASTWRAPSGRVGYVLVNVSNEAVRPALRPGVNPNLYRFTKITADEVQPLTSGARVEIPLAPLEVALVEEEMIP